MKELRQMCFPTNPTEELESRRSQNIRVQFVVMYLITVLLRFVSVINLYTYGNDFASYLSFLQTCISFGLCFARSLAQSSFEIF